MIEQQRRDTVGERRSRPTPPLSRYFLRGRRKGPRRGSDVQINYYVDRPAEQAITMAILLLALSLLDALLSLRLFALGTSHELNPLLDLTLRHGIALFLLTKLALSILATLVLMVHWNFALFGRFTLLALGRLLVGIYLALIAYEILLLAISGGISGT